jgi:hypothetical protein
LQIQPTVIEQLISSTQSDIRQLLNVLSTWRLSQLSMSFDQGKEMYAFVTTADYVDLIRLSATGAKPLKRIIS